MRNDTDTNETNEWKKVDLKRREKKNHTHIHAQRQLASLVAAWRQQQRRVFASFLFFFSRTHNLFFIRVIYESTTLQLYAQLGLGELYYTLAKWKFNNHFFTQSCRFGQSSSYTHKHKERRRDYVY